MLLNLICWCSCYFLCWTGICLLSLFQVWPMSPCVRQEIPSSLLNSHCVQLHSHTIFFFSARCNFTVRVLIQRGWLSFSFFRSLCEWISFHRDFLISPFWCLLVPTFAEFLAAQQPAWVGPIWFCCKYCLLTIIKLECILFEPIIRNRKLFNEAVSQSVMMYYFVYSNNKITTRFK